MFELKLLINWWTKIFLVLSYLASIKIPMWVYYRFLSSWILRFQKKKYRNLVLALFLKSMANLYKVRNFLLVLYCFNFQKVTLIYFVMKLHVINLIVRKLKIKKRRDRSKTWICDYNFHRKNNLILYIWFYYFNIFWISWIFYFAKFYINYIDRMLY